MTCSNLVMVRPLRWPVRRPWPLLSCTTTACSVVSITAVQFIFYTIPRVVPFRKQIWFKLPSLHIFSGSQDWVQTPPQLTQCPSLFGPHPSFECHLQLHPKEHCAWAIQDLFPPPTLLCSHLYALVLAVPLPKTFMDSLQLANSISGTQASILCHEAATASSRRLSHCPFLCTLSMPSATSILIAEFSLLSFYVWLLDSVSFMAGALLTHLYMHMAWLRTCHRMCAHWIALRWISE